jgi:hypothetical protein
LKREFPKKEEGVDIFLDKVISAEQEKNNKLLSGIASFRRILMKFN